MKRNVNVSYELYVRISMEVVNVSFTLLYQTRPLREWMIWLYVRQVTETYLPLKYEVKRFKQNWRLCHKSVACLQCWPADKGWYSSL